MGRGDLGVLSFVHGRRGIRGILTSCKVEGDRPFGSLAGCGVIPQRYSAQYPPTSLRRETRRRAQRWEPMARDGDSPHRRSTLWTPKN